MNAVGFSTLPRVSVIIAIRNEARFIERCLSAILEQDYPKECMEVLVADGHSTDTTREIIETVAGRFPSTRVVVLDNPGRIVSTGLNVALRQARGDFIIRIDGHTIIARDYVGTCVSALQRTGADNVGGRMDAHGETLFGAAVAMATSSPFGVGGARFHYSQKDEWVDTVYLGAWPRSVFERLGGFDEEQIRNQDDEFNYRLREAGGKILLAPAIRSCYYNRGTPGTLWRQYFQYGFWKVRVMQKHPKQIQLRQYIPPLFALGLGALAAGMFFSNPIRWAGAALLASYLLCCLIAAFRRGANRGGILQTLRVTSVFPMLHLSYGFGFLFGLVRFGKRWRDRVILQKVVLPV